MIFLQKMVTAADSVSNTVVRHSSGITEWIATTATHFIDTKPLKYESKIVLSINSKRCSLTTVLFVLCLLSVLRVLDVYLMSTLVLSSILIMDMSLFKQADLPRRFTIIERLNII